MATTITVSRVGAGYQEVTDGERTVVVRTLGSRRRWIAEAQWDRYLYTDIVPTAVRAKAAAVAMLADARSEA